MSDSSLCVHVSNDISVLDGGQMVTMQVWPSLVWSWATCSDTQLLTASMAKHRQCLPSLDCFSSCLHGWSIPENSSLLQESTWSWSCFLKTYKHILDRRLMKGILLGVLLIFAQLIFLWLILTPRMFFMGVLLLALQMKKNFSRCKLVTGYFSLHSIFPLASLFWFNYFDAYQNRVQSTQILGSFRSLK